ncbi:porin family protein [Bacteroides sp. 214]|uniref:outer membrane beta-barrel protein n=1 Tax=Bacteroides sp. 214 TaxID=2302935 RepID=UPI0013D3C55D|nr:outer membrane beta-barrel protein [Bacteroides sp. 214]NDW13746.1 porin family protein [Bacteroides sp. 214]
MKKENDELTNLFRTRLENTKMPVREEFWNTLQQDIPVVMSRRRQMMYRLSGAASVLLILIGASAAFLHFSPKEEISNAFTHIETTTGNTGKIRSDAVKEDLPPIEAFQTPSNNVAYIAPVADEANEEEFSFSFSMSFSVTETASDDEQNQTYANRLRTNENEATETEQQAPIATTKAEKTWAIKAHAGADVLSATEKKATLSNQGIAGTIKHKRSASFGLTVEKQLSDIIALETGLIYTQLNSELTASDAGGYFHQDQKLHYLGIPLKVNFTLLDSDKLTLYASAGAMAEKCIAGNRWTAYMEAGKQEQSYKETQRPNPLQFSLAAAVGLQYKVSSRFAVYAEPGISYYFDDTTPVATIRKEKPLNLNVRCGVRMTY